MHRAAVCGASGKTMDRFIEEGGAIDGRDLFDNTPLHIAKDTATLIALLDLGADGTAVNSFQETPLHIVMRDQDRFDPPVIDRLLRARADINATDRRVDTPLHIAARSRDFRANTLTRYLLKQGANIDAQNQRGNTPLHLAVMGARHNEFDLEDATWATISFGASFAVRYLNDGLGKSSLNMIELLLAAGARDDLRNNDGQTPLDVARADKKNSWVLEALTPPH